MEHQLSERVRIYKRLVWQNPSTVKGYVGSTGGLTVGTVREREIISRFARGTILEAGAGTGRITEHLTRLGHKVFPLDISQKMLQAQKDSLPSICGDVETLPFCQDKFDTVVAVWLLVHFPNWKEILAEFVRVLKTGGTLLFELSAKEHLEWALSYAPEIAERYSTPESYEAFVSIEELSDFLLPRGVRITEVMPYDHFNLNDLLRPLLREGPFDETAMKELLGSPKVIDFWCWLEERLFSYLPTGLSHKNFVVAVKSGEGPLPPTPPRGVLRGSDDAVSRTAEILGEDHAFFTTLLEFLEEREVAVFFRKMTDLLLPLLGTDLPGILRMLSPGSFSPELESRLMKVVSDECLVAGPDRGQATADASENDCSPLEQRDGQPLPMEPMGEFVSERGEQFVLLKGFRDRLKPGWHTMLAPRKNTAAESITESLVDAKRTEVWLAETHLQSCGLSFKGKRILEAGCHNGVQTYALAELGASSVHGIDIPEYGVHQAPDMELGEKDLRFQSEVMARLREDAGEYFEDEVRSRVSFSDLDVVELSESEVYDAIVSWDTLEHIQDSGRAFRGMFQALKPKGFCFHEYNPFFSMTGGHSLCTLDFPYGHCRLSTSDFRRYVETLRPDEVSMAVDFFEKNLNRMTLVNLTTFLDQAGFMTVSLTYQPWDRNNDFPVMRQFALPQAMALYPTVQEVDLQADSVTLIVVKPEPVGEHERREH